MNKVLRILIIIMSSISLPVFAAQNLQYGKDMLSCPLVTPGWRQQCKILADHFPITNEYEVITRIYYEFRNCNHADDVGYISITVMDTVAKIQKGLLYGKSRSIDVPGQSNYVLIDSDPDKTFYTRHKSSCSLVFTKAETIGPTNATLLKIRQALDGLQSLYKPYSLLFSKALILHTAYVNERQNAVCSVSNLISSLKMAFDIDPDKGHVSQITSLAAQDILIQAVKTAALIKSIDLNEADEWSYLVAHEGEFTSQCNKSIDFTPTKTACGGNIMCEINVDDYDSSKKELSGIKVKAEKFLADSLKFGQHLQRPDWVMAIEGVLK